MRNVVAGLREFVAERRYRAKCQVDVGAGASVRFRHLGREAPHHLTIGEGTIFQATISADRPEAVIRVGKNSFVGNSHLVCAERIEIGDDVLISWGCTIVDHDSHSTSWPSRQSDVADARRGAKDWSRIKVSPTIVRDKAWIGFNTILLKGVVVGEGAVVGAGSVVTKSVAPYAIVAGNPARVIRSRAEP